MCALIGRTDLDNNNDTNIKVNEKCLLYIQELEKFTAQGKQPRILIW
jgi:hypothetical protein